MSEEEVGGEKAVGRAVGWIRTGTERPFVTPWMSLRVDTGDLPDGAHFTYTYVEAAPAVFVVPLTDAGDIVLIRQYRYTVDAWCLEVPAGGTWDRRGQASIEVARDELREEIGGVADAIQYVAAFYPWHSRSDQIAHVYLARGVALVAEPERERTENIEVVPVPYRHALEMARRGEMHDGQSALALLLCERLLDQAGTGPGVA